MMTLDHRIKTLLKELTEAEAPPGFEGPVRRILRRQLEPLCDNITTDHLGSLIATRRGGEGGPTIMVAAHMDEVGFMVTEITDAGFIRFESMGGWWNQVLLAQEVTVITGSGQRIPGVIGSKPPHLLSQDEMKSPVKTKNMFIDIGATSRSEAEGFGVSPGDAIVPRTRFTPMHNPNLLMAKAWDDRAGCAILVELMRRLHDEGHPNTVSTVATVQEEVGLRGATTSVDVSDPDVALIVDVTIPTDTPGLENEKSKVAVGKGPVLTLYDASMIPHVPLRNLVVQTAREAGIPYQYEVMNGGGTDAGKIHTFQEGVPSLVVGLGARYIHSHVSVLQVSDLLNTIQLLAAVIQRLDAETVAGLTDFSDRDHMTAERERIPASMGAPAHNGVGSHPV